MFSPTTQSLLPFLVYLGRCQDHNGIPMSLNVVVLWKPTSFGASVHSETDLRALEECSAIPTKPSAIRSPHGLESWIRYEHLPLHSIMSGLLHHRACAVTRCTFTSRRDDTGSCATERRGSCASPRSRPWSAHGGSLAKRSFPGSNEGMLPRLAVCT